MTDASQYLWMMTFTDATKAHLVSFDFAEPLGKKVCSSQLINIALAYPSQPAMRRCSVCARKEKKL